MNDEEIYKFISDLASGMITMYRFEHNGRIAKTEEMYNEWEEYYGEGFFDEINAILEEIDP